MAEAQLSIFDALREPMIRRPIDPDGHVLQDEAQETFILPHHRYATPYCEIELHPSGNGLWMWSTCVMTDTGCYHGYKVGEKWGRFARTRDDALHYAVQEVEARLDFLSRDHRKCPSIAKILAWARSWT